MVHKAAGFATVININKTDSLYSDNLFKKTVGTNMILDFTMDSKCFVNLVPVSL